MGWSASKDPSKSLLFVIVFCSIKNLGLHSDSVSNPGGPLSLCFQLRCENIVTLAGTRRWKREEDGSGRLALPYQQVKAGPGVVACREAGPRAGCVSRTVTLLAVAALRARQDRGPRPRGVRQHCGSGADRWVARVRSVAFAPRSLALSGWEAGVSAGSRLFFSEIRKFFQFF